jgi:hypothetical protein
MKIWWPGKKHVSLYEDARLFGRRLGDKCVMACWRGKINNRISEVGIGNYIYLALFGKKQISKIEKPKPQWWRPAIGTLKINVAAFFAKRCIREPQVW